MIKKMAKSLLYVGCFTLLANLVISCEEDFTDIGTTIVSNNEFSTGDTVLEVIVTGKNIETVRADGLAIGGIFRPIFIRCLQQCKLQKNRSLHYLTITNTYESETCGQRIPIRYHRCHYNRYRISKATIPSNP